MTRKMLSECWTTSRRNIRRHRQTDTELCTAWWVRATLRSLRLSGQCALTRSSKAG